VVLALALAGAAGCGGGGKTAATTTVTVGGTNPTGLGSVTTHGRFHYTPAVISSYMASCTTGRPWRQAYCACTLDKLSNNVSYRDFTRLGLAGGQLSKRFRQLIRKADAACHGKL
jgi:hypothetical protein